MIERANMRTLERWNVGTHERLNDHSVVWQI